MGRRTRCLVSSLAVFAAVGLLVPAALAGEPEPLRRGVSDFAPVVTNSTTPQAHATPLLRRGMSDFTSAAKPIPAGTGHVPARVPVSGADGFDWKDAAIGAAATLGVVLLAGGLATGLFLRRRVALRSA